MKRCDFCEDLFVSLDGVFLMLKQSLDLSFGVPLNNLFYFKLVWLLFYSCVMHGTFNVKARSHCEPRWRYS